MVVQSTVVKGGGPERTRRDADDDVFRYECEVHTVNTQLFEQDKSPLVTASGLSDTYQPVMIKRNSLFKPIE